MSRLFRCTIAALAVGMTLAGCSSAKPEPKATSASTPAAVQPSSANEEPVEAAALLKAAGDKADAAGTVSYTMVMKTTVPGQGEVTTNAEGVSAMKPPLRGRIAMTMDIAGKPVAMEMLMTPDAMYIHYPPDMAKAFGGKAWVKMAFADLAKVGGVNFKQLMEQSQQNSPTAYLKALVAAGDVKEVGKESIRGTATTHYSGTISPDALTKAYSGDVQKQMETLIKQMGSSPITMDVWLAADGLPRRLHQVMTISGNAADILIEFVQFGAKLDVTAPPADQTTDFGKLLGGQPPA